MTHTRAVDLNLHQQPCPFPMRSHNGHTITDERCTCGHLRTEHHDSMGIAYGHGACAHDGCQCCQFTWREWVFFEQPKPDRIEPAEPEVDLNGRGWIFDGSRCTCVCQKSGNPPVKLSRLRMWKQQAEGEVAQLRLAIANMRRIIAAEAPRAARRARKGG